MDTFEKKKHGDVPCVPFPPVFIIPLEVETLKKKKHLSELF